MLPLTFIPRIHRVTHQLGLHIGTLAEPAVTQAEAHILDHLATRGASTVGDLHRAFAHRRSTLTSVLDRLSDRGFITRDASADDRRTFVVDLTAGGRKAATRVHDGLLRVERQALRALAKRDVEGFDRVLAAIEQTLAGSVSRLTWSIRDAGRRWD